MNKNSKITHQRRLTVREKTAANSKSCQPKPKNSAGGRPTNYRAKFCQSIIRFMSRGYSLTAFAASVGVSRQTIQNWAEHHGEFFDALTKARAVRTWYWERRLDVAGPDARAVIFALRNACSEEWKNNPDEAVGVRVTVNNDETINLNQPVEEWGRFELEAELKRRGALPVPPRD